MTETKYLTEAAYHGAPPRPCHRPGTRAELWAHYSHIYDGFWSRERIADFCREVWIWDYVYWVNFNGWDKQPDWKEDDPIVPAGVPTKPFRSDQRGQWGEIIYSLLHATRRAT